MQTLSVNVVDNKTTITNSTNVVYLKNVTNPEAVSYSPAGTVDYATGTITLNAITITSLEGNDGILFYAKPLQQDVQSVENDVLAIDIESGISVSVRKA
jgi:TolB-like protein